jgi:hypothetical protein
MDCIPLLLDHCNIDDYNPCILLSNMGVYLQSRGNHSYYENLLILVRIQIMNVS